MLKLKKVAITGGLSCGKSTVCRFFKEFGAYVVSADTIVHQLLSPETNLGQRVINLLGRDIIVDHLIDRSKIAKKVFNQPTLLKSLENILHPAVQDEIEKQYAEAAKQNVPLFVAEIPLLFESFGNKQFDYTIAVIADPKLCKQRFELTSVYDQNEYEKRAARQMDLSEKARRADEVIVNNGTIDQLKASVKKCFDKLTTYVL